MFDTGAMPLLDTKPASQLRFVHYPLFSERHMNTILVIDDNPLIRDTVSSYLSAKYTEYTVLTAEDGQQGMQALDAHAISLILTDLDMPNANGYQVLNYAKKNHPAIPAIVMSGSFPVDMGALQTGTGPAGYVKKPFKFEDLGRIVADALSRGPEIAPGSKESGRNRETP